MTNWKLVRLRAILILYGLFWMFLAIIWFSVGEKNVPNWQLLVLAAGACSVIISTLYFQYYERKVYAREFEEKYGIHASEFEEKNPDEIQEDDSKTKTIETIVEEYPKP